MSRFLLLLGPSGVGKSTIMDELMKLDARFTYISPYTTRPLRSGEGNKVSVSREEMEVMESRGEFVVVNELFGGILYGTPRAPIEEALARNIFPMLDWPADRMHIMVEAFFGKLCVIYVAPPSLSVLRERLAIDGRDADGQRFASAQSELERLQSGEYAHLVDHVVVSEEGDVRRVVELIHAHYLSSLGSTSP